jgi:hypothetical protein
VTLPDDLAAAALEALAGGRAEMRAAANTLALIKLGQLDPPPVDHEVGADARRRAGLTLGPELFVRRREIELRVAELRVSLWSEELRRLERDVRALGIRP